ncbi:hypothetical protein BS47DRAFT_1399815 [Hydnum rufescens UP504]|uniref:Uncharacterized protein n=1 Tax=Hydnum rufescens UP504 TaxID=1448309 RepID=A0A9P6DKB8_9AGAM|nr:hypothetical protein BS47DRAFT_1399815 [Hydnum rufescens UP504]
MVEIQHIAPHVPGDEVPTFLHKLILVPPPIANIPLASNKHHHSPTPLDGPSKWLKFDCVLIEGMDVDEQHIDQQHVNGLPDDKSAMDIDDPQDNPFKSLPLMSPKSSMSLRILRKSILHQHPQVLYVITVISQIGIWTIVHSV